MVVHEKKEKKTVLKYETSSLLGNNEKGMDMVTLSSYETSKSCKCEITCVTSSFATWSSHNR